MLTATKVRNLLIAAAAIVLTLTFALANQVKQSHVSLETLAESATPWEIAQRNDRPTLVEFYADWCSSCRAMAPMMADLKMAYADQINMVMLNVDNARWLPEMNQYQVNGIPHFVFLDAHNTTLSQSIGEQPRPVLEQALAALTTKTTIARDPLPSATIGKVSALKSLEPQRPIQPRTHG